MLERQNIKNEVKKKFSALASIYAGERPEYLDQALESLHKQTLQCGEA